MTKTEVEIDIPSLNHFEPSTHTQSVVTQDQFKEEGNFEPIGTELTKTATIQSVQKKMTDILDNPIFAGFLLILAGIAIAFQAGIK
jgi:hypothetical protein